MRALIDILKDEKNFISEIDAISRLIVKKTESLEEVKSIPIDCPSKENDIRTLSNRIGDLYVEQEAEMKKLENIREEIRWYVHTVIFNQPTEGMPEVKDIEV